MSGTPGEAGKDITEVFTQFSLASQVHLSQLMGVTASTASHHCFMHLTASALYIEALKRYNLFPNRIMRTLTKM